MSTSVPSNRAGHRQVLTPLGSTSWKRKKDENALELPILLVPPPQPSAAIFPTRPTSVQPQPKHRPKPRLGNADVEDASNSLVLAGYLAHEYLTRGTMMGREWNPTTTVAPGKKGKDIITGEREEEKRKRLYADMASLVTGENGFHVPGIVNPTELASWLEQKKK